MSEKLDPKAGWEDAAADGLPVVILLDFSGEDDREIRVADDALSVDGVPVLIETIEWAISRYRAKLAASTASTGADIRAEVAVAGEECPLCEGEGVMFEVLAAHEATCVENFRTEVAAARAEPAQPRSYRLDYKPGLREPEQVVDESALASLEGKPAVAEVETVLTDCRVEFNPEGSIPSPMGSLSVITGAGQPVRLFAHTRPGSAALAVMKIHEEILVGFESADRGFLWSIIWAEQEGPLRVEVHADAFAAFVDCSAVFRRLAEWHDHDVRPEHVRAWLLELGYRELS